MNESLDIAKIFKEIEVHNFFKEWGLDDDNRGIKIKKEDATTKDNHLLTSKQLWVLYNYFDNDVDIMIKSIKNNNYKEVSKMIGDALSNRKPYYNPHEDAGDR